MNEQKLNLSEKALDYLKFPCFHRGAAENDIEGIIRNIATTADNPGSDYYAAANEILSPILGHDFQEALKQVKTGWIGEKEYIFDTKDPLIDECVAILQAQSNEAAKNFMGWVNSIRDMVVEESKLGLNFKLFVLKKAGMTNEMLNKARALIKANVPMEALIQTNLIVPKERQQVLLEAYQALDLEALVLLFTPFDSFSIFDDVYPDLLKEIHNPPVLLFYQGNLDLLKTECLAFAGSREANHAGYNAVKMLIEDLKGRYTIVSGLGKGIHTVSHIHAVKHDTATIAVLGTGLDVFYPQENKKLQEFLGKNQLLLTEYGLGERPLKFHFPERSRIIAGLSKGLVLIEAKERSGSMITAERAMESNREIFCVAGEITDNSSKGCHLLIQQGAKLVTSADDIVNELEGNLK